MNAAVDVPKGDHPLHPTAMMRDASREHQYIVVRPVSKLSAKLKTLGGMRSKGALGMVCAPAIIYFATPLAPQRLNGGM